MVNETAAERSGKDGVLVFHKDFCTFTFQQSYDTSSHIDHLLVRIRNLLFQNALKDTIPSRFIEESKH